MTMQSQIRAAAQKFQLALDELTPNTRKLANQLSRLPSIDPADAVVPSSLTATATATPATPATPPRLPGRDKPKPIGSFYILAHGRVAVDPDSRHPLAFPTPATARRYLRNRGLLHDRARLPYSIEQCSVSPAHLGTLDLGRPKWHQRPRKIAWIGPGIDWYARAAMPTFV